uniref:18 kDa Sin3-associated polypeptide n=1 Tax=Steinernema glaseri TaxID=37863 RepID=A0A1I7XX49_9BILA
MTSVISQVTTPAVEKAVDREKICPLLLRIFPANGRHNPISDYARGATPTNELQIYTWMDCTLRELTSLIKDVNPEARRRGTQFEFAIISPEPNSPRFSSREIGNTTAGLRGVDDGKTLSGCKFVVGDYMDVAITLPHMQRTDRRGDRDFYRGPPRRADRDRDFNGTAGGRRYQRSPERFRDRD